MVKFELKVNQKQKTVYFNKNIVEALGYDLYAQLNATSGILYPKSADLEDVIRSVEIILEDLRHQAILEQKEVPTPA